MKRLLIIRHAKSSWDYPELSDFERPLNKRGKRDLPDMAQRLRHSSIIVEKWLSSPANRALKTALGHAKAFGINAELVYTDQRLYHASSKMILKVIAETNDQINHLALFGHNPGLTDLINELSGFDLWNLPTCAICGIEFDIDSWSQVLDIRGTMFYYDFPKSKNSME